MGRNRPNRNLPRPQPKTVTQVSFQRASFAGPLPPPDILEKYNQISPGAAERIIKMAEDQAKHRQDLERKVIDADIIGGRRGQTCGFIIGLAAVLGGTACALLGHQIAGTFIGGGGVTGLVGIFVIGNYQKRKEREGRFKALAEPQ